MTNKEKGIFKWLDTFYGKSPEMFRDDTLGTDPFDYDVYGKTHTLHKLLFDTKTGFLSVNYDIVEDLEGYFQIEFSVVLDIIGKWFSNKFDVNVGIVGTWS